MFGFDYRLEHVFLLSARLGPPEVIGPLSEGIRANFYVLEGQVRGPGITARVRPVGGDWEVLRRDGVGLMDIRLTLETDDGALIYVTYQGIADFGEGGYERFLRGELPTTLPLRISPRCQTAHPSYQWMNRLFLVGVGMVDLTSLEVRYDVYAVR